MLELQSHNLRDCMFVTLTFDEYFLPPDGNASPVHPQLFLKRLRERFNRLGITKRFKYLVASEYGTENGRVHYHLCFFGVGCLEVYYSPSDVEKRRPIYMHDLIHASWGQGFTDVKELYPESITYIVKYIMKGLDKDKDPHLQGRRRLFYSRSAHMGENAIDQLAAVLKRSPDAMHQITHNGDVPYKLHGLMPDGKDLILGGRLLEYFRLKFFDAAHIAALKADAAYDESVRIGKIYSEGLADPTFMKSLLQGNAPDAALNLRIIYEAENASAITKSKGRERRAREKGNNV